MIFADKLIDLRKKSGWSQEELAEKLNVSRQAVSKWEGAQSIPDMARIVQLSELFHVSTDYLLKDEMEQADGTEIVQDSSAEGPVRTIGMEEANAFLKVKEENSRRVAIAVMLCILSPVALILLGGAQSYGLLKWSENAAGGIGLVIMMLMIAPAVGLFVTSAQKISRYVWRDGYGAGSERKIPASSQPLPDHRDYAVRGIMHSAVSQPDPWR